VRAVIEGQVGGVGARAKSCGRRLAETALEFLGPIRDRVLENARIRFGGMVLTSAPIA
jgi:hypothetical protein